MKLLKKLKNLIFRQDDCLDEIKAAMDIYEDMSKEERIELRFNPYEVEDHIWIPIRKSTSNRSGNI
jgi:hypothetical protein